MYVVACPEPAVVGPRCASHHSKVFLWCMVACRLIDEEKRSTKMPRRNARVHIHPLRQIVHARHHFRKLPTVRYFVYYVVDISTPCYPARMRAALSSKFEDSRFLSPDETSRTHQVHDHPSIKHGLVVDFHLAWARRT